MRSAALDGFVAAGPPGQRAAMRVLVAIGARPRGARLLAVLAPPLDRLARAALALARYDDPVRARSLGWDAAAVAARGLLLRREEERP